MSDQVYVIYHAACPDGFGAAWAAHRHFSKYDHGKNIHYLPRSYTDPFPDTVPDSEVFILDLSYPPDVIINAHMKHKGKVLLLDHHKTAQEALQYKIPNCHFNMNHSGAHMAWNWWFPQGPVPELVAYIQDRDLWKWELPNSREVAAALHSYPMDFDAWNALDIETLIQQGRPIYRYMLNVATKLALQAQWTVIRSLRTPAVNSSILHSEICEQILNIHPGTRFAAVYSDSLRPNRPNHLIRRWSLRSRPGSSFDVGQIAKDAGGGGHRNAAGFTETILMGPRTTQA